MFVNNYLGPIFFIFIVPLIVIFILLKSTTISTNIYPNLCSLIILGILLLYGYLSIKLSRKKFTGPENVDGDKPEYAANGFEFYIVSVVLVTVISFFFKQIPKIFTENFIPLILTFNIFGLLFVTYLYFKYKNNYYDKENDDKQGYSGLFRFYRGLKYHPRILGVDIKQWTNCRFAMINWQIFILIFLFYFYNKKGFNLAIFVTVLLQSIYIGKFFYWETGYFNTLDITLDKAGYYICWGCLVFLPAFYTLTTYYLVNKDPKISMTFGLTVLALGLFFIYKNYEVDAQKELFKKDKDNAIINGEKAKFLPVEYMKDGKLVNSSLLLSGHWGDVRHKNYSYEILLSACWSAVGYQYGVIPFLYLFYIILLLVHRIYRDENKCANKYGKYWIEYCKIVPYRLLKNIY